MARPKKPKTDPKAPGAKAAEKAAAAAPKKGHNSNGSPELSEAQRQDLFLSHKRALILVKNKLATMVANVRNAKKKIKADGFTVKQVEAAIRRITRLCGLVFHARAAPFLRKRGRRAGSYLAGPPRRIGASWMGSTSTKRRLPRGSKSPRAQM